jgi:tetratricopeptide (TPR) repeat protein
MAKRYFNWKLAVVLVIGLVVLGVASFALRQWQRSTRAERALILGQKAYDEDKWREAASDLGRYLALHQNDVPVLLKYADAQLKVRPTKSGNVQQAVQAYRSVLRIDSNNSEAVKQLVQIYLAVGTPGEAELIAERYLETNKDPEIQRMLAVALANQRMFSEAAEQLRLIINEYPDQVLAYAILGRLTERRPREFTEPAVFWFDQAVQNNPSSALAYITRADFYLTSGDKQKALNDLQQAEQQDLSDPQVRLQLAREFINADLLDKAEVHLNAVKEVTPANQMLWQIWADLAMKSNSQEKTLEVAETALQELASQPWDFMPAAVELFIHSGQLERASDYISKMRQEDIYPAAIALFEGLIARSKGLTSEAIKSWYRAVELGDTSIRTRLLLTSAISRSGDTQSALRLLRTLVSEFPNSFDVRLALTRLLARTGNWKSTAEHAAIAMQLSPRNLEAAILNIQARIQLIDPNLAVAYSRQVQDINQRLVELEKATDGALEVKILQFQLAMLRRDFQQARQLVTQLKSNYSSQMKTVIAEVDLLIAEEKQDQAISLLAKIREQFPEAVEPVKYLAVLLEQKGDRQQCELVVKEALDQIQQPLAQRELALLLADFYSHWQRQEEVFNLLNEIETENPDDIPVKRRLLVCPQVINNPEKAQQLVGKIKSLEGDQGWQWKYEQARVWFNADDFRERYPQIVSFMQENLLANPADQASRLLLAATYDRVGELELAISTYREALNRTSDDLRVIIPAAAALYKSKKYDEAEEVLNRASQQELYHPELQRLQLQNYIRRGQFAPAADILQDFLDKDPNNQALCLSLALLNIRQNQFTEAEELLNRLKIQDPNSLPVTSAQIQLNIRQGKTDQALQLCDDLVNDLNDTSAYILRARTYGMLGQPEKAIEDFNNAVLMDSGRAEPWVARSDFYRAIGQPVEAGYDIQQALYLQPDNIQIQKRVISLFLASGDPAQIAKANAVLDGALKSNPEDISLQLFKARLLIAKTTGPAIEEAQQILEKITQDRPEIVDAWVILGQILLRQAQPGKAIDVALRGLVHRPNDKRLLILKADAEAASSPVLSVPTLKLLREIDPNDVDVAVKLANTYIETQEPHKAVALLKEQLDVCDASNIRKCKLALATALHKNGDKDSAKKEFDFLSESEPNDPSPLIAQARLLKDDKLWSILKQKVADWCQDHPKDSSTPVIIARGVATAQEPQALETAEDILRMVLEQHPSFSPALMSLAMILQSQDSADEAAKLYQQILDVEPDNVIVINNLAWALCQQQDKYQQALELAERGLKLVPNYTDLIDTRGVIYYHLGQYERAIQDFTECLRLYPSNVPPVVATRFHLAKACAQLGREDSAIVYLNQALDLESRIGGLSSAELEEAQSLLERLKKGD